MDAPDRSRGVIIPIDWHGDIDVIELKTTLSGIAFHPDLELIDLPTYFGLVGRSPRWRRTTPSNP